MNNNENLLIEQNNNGEKQKKKRQRLTFEVKLELMKLIKRYLAIGLTYQEMQEKIKQEKGIKLAMGTLFKFILSAKEDIISSNEAARIFLERYEKRRYIEREAIILYNQVKSGGDQNLIIKTLDLLSKTQEATDNYLSRFNLIPAVPLRQELELKPKLPLHQLIDALIEIEKKIELHEIEKKS